MWAQSIFIYLFFSNSVQCSTAELFARSPRVFCPPCFPLCVLCELWTVCVVCWVCCVLYILCAFHCACFPLKCGYRPALGCPTVPYVQFCDTFAVQCAVCSVHKCAILHWAMCHVHCPLLSSWTGGHFQHFQVHSTLPNGSVGHRHRCHFCTEPLRKKFWQRERFGITESNTRCYI